MSLLTLRLQDIHTKLVQGECTVTDLVQASFQRIEATDNKIKAFLALNEEEALRQAAEMDAKLAGSSDKSMGLLYGLPVGLKDNISTEQLKTTCASQYLDHYMPIFNATVYEKLNDANAITVGKLNMDEFAMGGSTENSSYFPTRNPWNLEHVPGGSSGGSAAAVAAEQVYFALGSDTGGSIRQPAAFCGVVGLKPTYGRVSRYGVVAFASSLDQVGPITRNVEDAAYVLQTIAGYDSMDTTSVNTDVGDYASALTGDIKGLKIGVPKQYLGEGINPGVKARIMDALHVLESLGATCEEVSLPHTEYALAAYYILASSEASSNLSRFDGIRYGTRSDNAKDLLDIYTKSRSEGFGDEIKRRIMLGTYALSSGYYDAYYVKAQKVRTLVKQDFDQVFSKYDVLVGPTTPAPAFKLGTHVNDPLTMYLNDIYSIPVSMAGNPAISVPCGLEDGLPVGMQVIGKAFDESTILRVAHAFEQNTEHHTLKPQLNAV